MNNPLVSIIIPTYNRAHLIGETLDSIMAQTYTNWECIVVDDESTDNSESVITEYVEKDSRIQFHHRPADRSKGGNAARNYGFEMSKGDYVIWFDSDDLMYKNKIELQVEAMNVFGADIVIDKYNNYSNATITEKEEFRRNLNKIFTYKNFIRYTVFFGTINVLLKRSALSTIKFNECLRSGQEYHFFIGVLLQNNNTYYLDQILCSRRIGLNSIQNNQNRFEKMKFENRLLTFENIYIDYQNKLDIAERKYIIKKILIYRLYLDMEDKKILPVKIFKTDINFSIGVLKKLLLYGLLLVTFISRNKKLLFKGNLKRLYYKI